MRTPTAVTASKTLIQLSTGMRYIVIVYVAYHLWHSPVAVGATLGLPSLAQVMLAPLGGIIADDYHRPRVIALTQLVAVLGIGAILALTLLPPTPGLIVPLYILAWLLAGTEVLAGPSYTTLLADVLDEGSLVVWQARVGAWGQAAWLAGTLLAGLAISAIRAPLALAIILALTILALVVTLLTRDPRETSAGRNLKWPESPLRTLPKAWRHLRTDPFLWAFLIVVSLSNIPHNVLLALPLFLSLHLNAGFAGFGGVEAALIVGTVAADAWFARKVRAHRLRRLLVVAFALQSAIAGLMWVASGRSILVVSLLMAAYGATDALFIPAYSRLSSSAPTAIRGQVLGLFNLVAVLMNPVVSVATGWLLTSWSPQTIVLSLIGVFGALAVIVGRMGQLNEFTAAPAQRSRVVPSE